MRRSGKPKKNNQAQCALADADYIITGDSDLLILKKYRSTTIITVSEYLKLVG
jgi:predicted nucleic acid-binding protein